jgi:DNA replication protein DnaC
VALTEVSDVVCGACGGSGWLAVDGVSDQVRPCSCRRRRSVSRLLEEAAIPVRYEHCRLGNFKPGHDSAGGHQLVRALSLCGQYVKTFAAENGPGFRDTGLLLTGPPGVGKTHLAVAVLHDLIVDYRARGLFVDFTSLTHELQSALDRPGAKTSALITPLERAEVLVLDELGSLKLNSWTRDILYNLVNGRYRRRRPTLFTTNYRLEEEGSRSEQSLDRGPDLERLGLLSSRIPPMLVSRLYEMAQPIVLDAVSDYRRDVHALQHRV